MSKNRSPIAKSPIAKSIVVVVALLVAALSAALLLVGLGSSGQAATPGSHPQAPSDRRSAGAPQAAGESQPEAGPESEPSEPAAEPQAEADADPEPQPEPQPEPGVLSVGPASVDLADGQWTAQFVVANVGGSDMNWFAVGVPSEVGLSQTQGTLAAGTEAVVTATIDHTQLAKGPFSLTLHVSANDTAESVTFTGVKKVKVIGPVGPGDLNNG